MKDLTGQVNKNHNEQKGIRMKDKLENMFKFDLIQNQNKESKETLVKNIELETKEGHIHFDKTLDKLI